MKDYARTQSINIFFLIFVEFSEVRIRRVLLGPHIHSTYTWRRNISTEGTLASGWVRAVRAVRVHRQVDLLRRRNKISHHWHLAIQLTNSNPLQSHFLSNFFLQLEFTSKFVFFFNIINEHIDKYSISIIIVRNKVTNEWRNKWESVNLWHNIGTQVLIGRWNRTWNYIAWNNIEIFSFFSFLSLVVQMITGGKNIMLDCAWLRYRQHWLYHYFTFSFGSV